MKKRCQSPGPRSSAVTQSDAGAVIVGATETEAATVIGAVTETLRRYLTG